MAQFCNKNLHEMKNLNHYFLGLICVICVLFGCDNMESQWTKAKSKNNIEAYENFLDKYPESEYADSVKNIIIDLYLKAAQKENTLDGFKKVLIKFENHVSYDSIKQVVSNMAYDKIEQENTIQGYEQFIKVFPSSSRLEEAKGLDKNNFPIWEPRLGKFSKLAKSKPGSYFSLLPKVKIIEINFEDVKKENSIKAYEEFINKYPQSSQADEALNTIMILAYEEIKTSTSINELMDYLGKYPKSSKFAEASSQLVRLFARKANGTNSEAAKEEIERQIIDYISKNGIQGRYTLPKCFIEQYFPSRTQRIAEGWTFNSVLTFSGEFQGCEGYVIQSEDNHPLKFAIIGKNKIVYLYGKGSVEKNGKTLVSLP